MDQELKDSILANRVSITELSSEKLISVGFQKLDDESGVLLIPLWAYEFIPVV